ncbi:MAG: flavodoxin family protein [Candidatus Thorarchaeota archaeon]
MSGPAFPESVETRAMLIVGISGSPKTSGSNTAILLQKALDAAAEYVSSTRGISIDTKVIDVSRYNIRRCTGCDRCVRRQPCPESESDDIPVIEKILREADGIIIAAPSYFTGVPGVLKDLIDRTRPMKMMDHQLKDKVFGAITYAGLRYGGQETVVDFLNRYALAQGMIVVGALGSPVKNGTFGSGSMQTDDGKWRKADADPQAIESSVLLGKRVAEVILKLHGAGAGS